MADGPIVCVIQFDLITGDATIPTRPVSTRVTYDPLDPYAVRLFFNLGGGKIASWVVSRELLAAGMLAQTGIGDFRLGPGDDQPGLVQVTLSSPTGIAHFTVSADELDGFLRSTFAVVPLDTEMDHVNVDAELAGILEEASRG